MKTAIKVDGARITLGPVKVCYVNVFEARSSFEGTDPKFSVRLLIDKTDPNIEDLLTGIHKATNNAINISKEKGKFSKGFPATGKIPLKDGDTTLNSEGTPNHPGCWYMDAKSQESDKPSVVDIHHNPIMDKSEVYSGCYAVVALTMYGYDALANKGISCGLSHFMKAADGEPMGGKIPLDKAFAGFELDTDSMLA